MSDQPAFRVRRDSHRIPRHFFLQANGQWWPCKCRGFCRECNRRAPPRAKPDYISRESLKHMPIVDRIRTLAANILRKPVEEIAPDTALAQLGADSIDMAEIAIDIEDAFEMEITDEQVEQVRTAADFAAIVEARQPGGFVA